MTATIQVLPDAVVNRIAAGEVVERPFSVVKELVENALDAGATRVEVELSAGGKDLIRVTDDGCGIQPDELRRALERHATSKIRDADELEGIGTLGFRGEALPSIASVSKFRIVTRVSGSDEAREILLAGGTVEYERAAGGAAGTRVEVEELFFNTPARRAFLKADATELRHVTDWMQRLALARPTVGFRLEQGGRRYVDAPPAQSLQDRIGSVLGRDVARDLFAVDGLDDESAVTGYVARPGRTRTNAGAIHLVVNDRVIRDRGVVHAISTGYGTMLPPGRYPVAVLVLDVPPSEVDVNVHPAKTEVRFRDPQAIHRLVRRAVRDTLRETPWAGAGGDACEVPGAPGPEATPFDRFAAPPSRGGGAPLDMPWRGDVRESLPGAALGPAHDGVRDGLPSFADAAGDLVPASGYFGSLKPLGQLHLRYIVCEGAVGLVLVDQHAAHERITFERLRTQLREGTVATQPLLIPETIDVGAERVGMLDERRAALERLGFVVEAFGEASIVVRSVPALLTGAPTTPVLEDVLDPDGALEVVGGSDPVGPVEEILGTMACHGSIRTGRALEAPEMRALLEDLDRTDFRGNCPHGRNVFLELGVAEIERKVGR